MVHDPLDDEQGKGLDDEQGKGLDDEQGQGGCAESRRARTEFNGRAVTSDER